MNNKKNAQNLIKMQTFQNIKSIKPIYMIDSILIIRSSKLSLATPEKIRIVLGIQGIMNYKRINIRNSNAQLYFDWLGWVFGLVDRVFANGLGDLGSIPGRVIPKALKMVLDTSLLNTQQYKVCIKSKVAQSREKSCALPNTFV